jgi:hypothetical protein
VIVQVFKDKCRRLKKGKGLENDKEKNVLVVDSDSVDNSDDK